MVKRKCPKCKKEWFSAAESSTWECECGQTLRKELNEAVHTNKK